MTRLRVAPLESAVFLAQLESEDGLNRLSLALLNEIAGLALAHPRARTFILAGSERCFSAGADLADMARLSPANAWRLAHDGQRALRAIATLPIVAAVRGHCLGGGFDLALSCRVRVCTPDAYFGHHGARLGLITGWSGTQTLPRLLGSPRTLEHLLSAQGWTAPLALQHGLVSSVAPVEAAWRRPEPSGGETRSAGLALPTIEARPPATNGSVQTKSGEPPSNLLASAFAHVPGRSN